MVYFWIVMFLQLKFRKRIWDHDCVPNDLYALLPAMSSDGFALTSPAEASVFCENLVASGCAGVCGVLGCLRGQCRALLSSVHTRIPSATDSQTSTEILLVSCTRPKLSDCFSFHHFEVHSWVQIQYHKSLSSMTWSGIKQWLSDDPLRWKSDKKRSL